MQKMNQLPVNAVMTTKELRQRGFTNQDLTRAGKEGVLVHCGYGVWARHVPLCLYEALKTFQKESQSGHIGGRTILHRRLFVLTKNSSSTSGIAGKRENIQMFLIFRGGFIQFHTEYSTTNTFLMNAAVSSNVTDCTGLLPPGHCLRALT